MASIGERHEGCCYPVNLCTCRQIYAAEIETLQAENERLRALLVSALDVDRGFAWRDEVRVALGLDTDPQTE